mgnify:CR=1 FL=1
MKKMINTEKLHVYNSFPLVYIICSIPVSGWRATTKQKHVKKQSEIQVDMLRSSSSKMHL